MKPECATQDPSDTGIDDTFVSAVWVGGLALSDETWSRLGETDPQDVAVRLQLRDPLELNPELVALCRRELLEFANPALQVAECCAAR